MNVEFFDIAKTKAAISVLKTMFNHRVETIERFVSNTFESEEGNDIEIYEFVDLLLILKEADYVVTKEYIQAAIRKARIVPLERPWEYNDEGVCSMPEALKAVHDLFHSMDQDGNGVLTKPELYGIVLDPVVIQHVTVKVNEKKERDITT